MGTLIILSFGINGIIYVHQLSFFAGYLRLAMVNVGKTMP